MGCVRGATDVLHVKGRAQGIEFALEFSPVVSPYSRGIAKNLKNFFLNRVCNGSTGFVRDEAQDAKFTKATDGTQNVDFTGGVPEADDKVKRPLASGACR